MLFQMEMVLVSKSPGGVTKNELEGWGVAQEKVLVSHLPGAQQKQQKNNPEVFCEQHTDPDCPDTLPRPFLSSCFPPPEPQTQPMGHFLTSDGPV